MTSPIYTVEATWVRSGTRVADGLRRTLYRGRDGVEAEQWEEGLLAWARVSRCGGSVIVEVFEGRKIINAQSVTIAAAAPIFSRVTGGYPAHECGKPMVPADVVGAKVAVPMGHLFCVGCSCAVSASQADRLRAAGAASAERKARRA